jgi:hypothetical protein
MPITTALNALQNFILAKALADKSAHFAKTTIRSLDFALNAIQVMPTIKAFAQLRHQKLMT